MRARDSLKCRERLAIENFIRTNKVKGVALHFTEDDIVESSTYPLKRAGLRKTLYNMAYTRAGVKRGATPKTYLVDVDNHVAWAEDADSAMSHAHTSTFKRRAGKKPKRQRRVPRSKVAARGGSVTTAPAVKQKEEVPRHLSNFDLGFAAGIAFVSEELLRAMQVARERIGV